MYPHACSVRLDGRKANQNITLASAPCGVPPEHTPTLDNTGWMLNVMPANPILGWLRQEDHHEYEASLDYIAKPYLTKTKRKTRPTSRNTNGIRA